MYSVYDATCIEHSLYVSLVVYVSLYVSLVVYQRSVITALCTANVMITYVVVKVRPIDNERIYNTLWRTTGGRE